MTFKEAMEHYRAGTATEEQRQLVEEELEKSRLISEYMDSQWEETISIPNAPTEEIKQVRKSLRRRNALIVLTSVLMAAMLLLGTVCLGIPAAEKLYWNPATASYGTAHYTDLELMLAAYAELFCPDINISGVTASKSGFASYDISIRYWNAHRGGDIVYFDGTVELGVLYLPQKLWNTAAINIFDRATYPFYAANKAQQQAVYDKISRLPEYLTVVAAVSFPQDKTIEEVLAFQDSLINGQVGWTAIRSGPVEEQLLPLCGMHMNHWGSVRTEINDSYPYFDVKFAENTPANLETHFKSLLRFSADQVRNGTGIPEEYRTGQCYYTEVLQYVEENGIYSYGCYVTGTPETILSLMESGAVSQVMIADIWISI